jgi:wyosine [tRNA(Phe)-imidazoG37] synthetase (radical SAM superfamily)
MKDKTKEEKYFTNKSTIYGPVKSWRFGQSLGVDPIFHESTCSFNCIYCQLGQIQNITTERKVYIETDKVISDYKNFLSKNIDFEVLTFSGSGEPTLAKNLGEMVSQMRVLTPHKKFIILTNATELHDQNVREDLMSMDRVILKLDSLNEDIFQKINRPAEGVTLDSIKKSILEFQQTYSGKIDIQTMFMNLNKNQIEDYARFLIEVKPDSVQLNTPKRPYPLSWHRENRGNHLKIFDYEIRELQTLSQEDAKAIEDQLKKLTGLKIHSIYH